MHEILFIIKFYLLNNKIKNHENFLHSVMITVGSVTIFWFMESRSLLLYGVIKHSQTNHKKKINIGKNDVSYLIDLFALFIVNFYLLGDFTLTN